MSTSKSRADTDRHLTALMRAAQDGDQRAYAVLLREITPVIRRWVLQRRSFLQRTDIEDIVQDILLSLHTVRATYDPRRAFLPWLRAIAHNRMVDNTRRYVRRSANEVAVERLPEPTAPEATGVTTDTYGDREALRQAIDGLPPRQREAVQMLKLNEMSLKEAAAVSGTSVGALKVAVHRGMVALRKALGPEA